MRPWCERSIPVLATANVGRVQRLGDRLAGTTAVLGRERELAALRSMLRAGEGPVVVFVSGAGGVGKSTVVAGAVAGHDRPVVRVDGREIEPSPSAFVRAVTAGLGDAAGLAGVGVLVVDGFERLNLLDGWLRNDFLVTAPADLTTVLVGRRPPNLAWRTSPGWRHLVAELAVGPLDAAGARLLVDRRGLPPAVAERVLRFGQGHPLALELAAEAFGRHPDLDLPDGPLGEVVEELFEVLLDDLEPAERTTVEAASVLRRITQPQLAAVLADEVPGVDVAQAWRVLRRLPFTVTTSAGLELAPVAHTAIGGALEIRDPGRVLRLRRRGAVAALRDAGEGRSWAATADLLHLVQNPVIRNAYVPPGDQQHPVEAAVADDLAAVLAITERHDGPAGASVVASWWRSHRADFVVARGAAGEVTAFSVVVRLSALDRRLADIDPVLAAVLADVDRRPLGRGAEALVARRTLGLRRGERPSPEHGAMVVDIKRHYLALRPALARVYTASAEWPAVAPVLRAMGFAAAGAAVQVGSRSYQPCVLDFGPDSVDGWLVRHVLGETAPAPRVEGPAVAGLSAREREVLAVLAEGVTNHELAERLFISERTANRHLSNIFTKLGVRTRTAAARVAIEAGLA